MDTAPYFAHRAERRARARARRARAEDARARRRRARPARTRTSCRSSTPRSPASTSGPDALAAARAEGGARDRPDDGARRSAGARWRSTSALPNYTNNLRRFGYDDDDFADGGTRPARRRDRRLGRRGRDQGAGRRAPRRRRGPRLRAGADRPTCTRAADGRVAPSGAGPARVARPAALPWIVRDRERPMSKDRWAEILGYLADAAEDVGLDPDVHRRLQSPSRVLEVSVPVRMDDGSHRGLHRLARAPRHHPRPGQGRHPLPPRRRRRRGHGARGGDDVQDRGDRTCRSAAPRAACAATRRRCRSASSSGSPAATRGRSCRCSARTRTCPRPT